MKLTGSSKCSAAKLLLIFAGCDLVGQVLCFCELGKSVSEGIGITASFPGFIATSLHLITKETGSFSLLLTFLYINFQDTNSLSLPRQKPKKFHSLYKQDSPQRRKTSTSTINKEKKNKKKKKGANKDKFPPDYDDYGKSKHTFLPDIPPTVSTSSTTTSAGRIKNRNRVKSVHSPHHNSPSIKRDTKNKKNKTDRRKQNVNRMSTTAASLASTGSLMGSVILNENEEDTLRRKILEKIEELDPLMCLPKVLCGHSNRSRRKKKYPGLKYMTSSTTTSTTNRPVIGEEIIDEYIQLLQIVHPIEKLEEKPQSDITDKKKNADKKGNSEEDDENQSESSSSESEEYPKRVKYPNAGLSNEGKIWYTKGEHSSETKDEEDGDEGEEDDEFEEEKDEDLLEDMLDEEDMQHIIEREKMKKLMGKSGEFSGESWWDQLDDYKLPFHPQYPNSLKNDLSKHSEETSNSWFSSIPNMLSNMMPMFSWGGSGSNKDDDDFKHDPFFTSFDGRSLTSRGGKGLSDRWKVPSGTKSKSKTQRTSRDDIDLEKLFGIRDTKQLDSVLGQDPAEKFRVAVEIGKKVAHPRQCDFIYNGCPLTYEEILAIINEPLKQVLGTANHIVPAAAKKNYTHNYITLPHLQAIVNPQHQFQYHPATQHIIYQPQPHYQYVHYPAPAHATQIVQYQTQPTQVVQYHTPPQPTHLIQYQQYSPPQEPTVDDVSPIIPKTKHKTRIHQALPGGGVEINLMYSESAESNKAKSGLPAEEILELTNNLTTTQDSASVEDESPFLLSAPSSSSSSISLSVPILESHADEQFPPEHSPSRKPTPTPTDFSSYNFFPSKRYQIRRKGYPQNSPEKHNIDSASTTGSGSSSSSSSFEERHVELNSSVPSKNSVTDSMMKQQRPVAIPFTKVEGKYKFKKLLKQTPTLPPPARHSTNLRTGKAKKNGNQNGKNSSKKKKGRDSISFLKSTKRKKAQLMLQQQKERLLKKKMLKKKIRNNKGKHKAHLHKQSSKSNRAKNHHRIAHRNEKYHVYGHPFPPHAGYYKKRKQKIATTTSPSFFSYIFGR